VQLSEESRYMRMSSLAGAKVRNPDGNPLGEIEELVVNVREGAIESALLRIDADGAKCPTSISVPWSQLRFHADGRCFELDISLRTLIEVASGERHH
jgi:sporulation protein YlmC with PRC-barrel domain